MIFGVTSDGLPLRRMPLIFFIGLNKTGTRSLTQLLRSQSIPSVHWDQGKLAKKMLENLKSGKRILDGYDREYLAFSDMIHLSQELLIEGASFFKDLYEQYPNSMFILNTRETPNWLQSRVSHDNGKFMTTYMAHIGAVQEEYVLDWWAEQKQSHEAEVRKFFRDKQSQFAEINVEKDDVVEKLRSKLAFSISGELQHLGKTQSTLPQQTQES